MISADRVRVTTFVAVAPSDAFEVFTQETDLWWRKGPRYRNVGTRGGTLRFEGGANGRLVEEASDGRGASFEIGRVLVWEPGARLVFQWRASNFVEGEVTEVEVRFEPARGGTQVTIEHRGWDAIRADHPVRHGLDALASTSTVARWWSALATSLREHVLATRASAP